MSDELIKVANKEGLFPIRSIPLANMVNSIKRALIFKQAEMQQQGITIKNITLTLKTVATSDSGTQISLEIPILGKIRFGSEISEKSVQTTSLTLKTPANSQFQRGLQLNKMDETIAQSISSIIEGVKAAGKEDSISLEMEEAAAEFNFILSGENKISLIIETGFESELSNNLKLKFIRT